MYVALGELGEIRLLDLKKGSECKTINAEDSVESVVFHIGSLYMSEGKAL